MKKWILSCGIIAMLCALFSMPVLAADGDYLSIDKTGVWNDANNNGYAEAGETVDYTYVVTNLSGLNFEDLVVTDPGVSVTGGSSTLGGHASTTFTGAYTLTSDDVATGFVESTATATATRVVYWAVEATVHSINGNTANTTGWRRGDDIIFKVTISNLDVITIKNITVNMSSTGDIISINNLGPGENAVIYSSVYNPTPKEIAMQKIDFPVTCDVTSGTTDAATDSCVVMLPQEENCEITVTPDPASIVGNGTNKTLLTATVTTEGGDPVSGVTVNFLTSEYNDDGNFFSDESCTKTARTAVTDGNGIARIYYLSTNLESQSTEPTIFNPISFDVYAIAADATRDLYATDSFEITFVPGTLRGVLYDNTTGSYLADTEITISLSNTDNNKVWSKVLTTDGNGEYSTYVPWSDETYTISYVKTVETVDTAGGTVKTDITFSQTGTTGDNVGEGGTYDSDKTITGLVLKKDNETSSAMMLNNNDLLNYAVFVYSGTDPAEEDSPVTEATLGANGQYTVTGLDTGTYTVVVMYKINGQTLIAGSKTVTIGSNGQMTISEVLIDPYGTITDVDTGDAVNNVNVTLYYANTQRNINNGVTPNTVVPLPEVSGFDPNDNINADTDADGEYAFMVFPATDYYIIATADGYETYTSPTLNVEYTALNHDIVMTPATLNSIDHFKYVVGYPDGTVRPNSDVTRAEAATMFYRLLTSARRDAIFTSSNSFGDVTSDRWYNKAVSSMANGAYILGYPDGSFGGTKAITRAEFVSIAARFVDEQAGTVSFTDVPTTYWAYPYISTAVYYGWIEGYSDSTFQPDQPITRAEAMTVINRILHRGVDDNGVMTGFKDWPDNDSSAWYYYEVIEATNDHEYTGTRPSEQWTSLTTNYTYDIAKYENPGDMGR